MVPLLNQHSMVEERNMVVEMRGKMEEVQTEVASAREDLVGEDGARQWRRGSWRR